MARTKSAGMYMSHIQICYHAERDIWCMLWTAGALLSLGNFGVVFFCQLPTCRLRTVTSVVYSAPFRRPEKSDEFWFRLSVFLWYYQQGNWKKIPCVADVAVFVSICKQWSSLLQYRLVYKYSAFLTYVNVISVVLYSC